MFDEHFEWERSSSAVDVAIELTALNVLESQNAWINHEQYAKLYPYEQLIYVEVNYGLKKLNVVRKPIFTREK